jgi:hypothetical protein
MIGDRPWKVDAADGERMAAMTHMWRRTNMYEDLARDDEDDGVDSSQSDDDRRRVAARD